MVDYKGNSNIFLRGCLLSTVFVSLSGDRSGSWFESLILNFSLNFVAHLATKKLLLFPSTVWLSPFIADNWIRDIGSENIRYSRREWLPELHGTPVPQEHCRACICRTPARPCTTWPSRDSLLWGWSCTRESRPDGCPRAWEPTVLPAAQLQTLKQHLSCQLAITFQH